jgi:hypothetical protein
VWRQRLSEISDNPELARAIWMVTAFLVCCLHLFVHGTNIDFLELPLDDAGTWGVARRSLGTLLTLPTEFHSQPPLYYITLHFLLPISSEPWFIRGYSWFWLLLVIQFVLFYFDELTLLSRVFFCLVLILGGLTSYLSTAVRPYGMAAFFTLGSLVLFARTLCEPTRRRLWAYGVWTVLMLYSTAFVVATFAVQGLFLLGTSLVEAVTRGWRATWQQRRGLLLVQAAVALAYVPYLAMALHYQYQPNATDTLALVLTLATYQQSLANLFQFSDGVLAALYALSALALVAGLVERRLHVWLWPLLIVAQIAFVWYFILGRPGSVGVQAKYLMPAYLALIVLATQGFQQLTARTRISVWVAVPVLLAVLVIPHWRGFHSYMQAPVPSGYFGMLHSHLARQSGKKLMFFDTGYEGQHMEYVTRHDPNIQYALMWGPRWASGGDNHLTAEYITDVVKRTSVDTSCYFYYLEIPNGVYATAFVPLMNQLGYRPLPNQISNHRGRAVNGFCR